MGKYHCTADLLFDLFALSCIAFVEFTTDNLFGQIKIRQTGGQRSSENSSYKPSEYSLINVT